jgi:N-acetylglucosaminyldiphosphoundecaprenol N-acetyl-beta-D-mannosaminyltransferase
MTERGTMTATKTILGVPVSQVTYADALEQMRAWLNADAGGPARTIVAANVHVVTETCLDSAYGAAVRSADLIVPDGMPLVWASRMLGGRLNDRCYGPTLMEMALDRFRPDCRHVLYGGTDRTLADLQTAIAQRWPGTRIAGALSPPFGPPDARLVESHIAQINAWNPDLLWVAMGCPKQEFWMAQYRDRLRVKVIAAVGAAFDFLSGTVPQAPPWMQRAGLEWAFRLGAEPRRLWRRYLLRNPYFVARFALQLLRRQGAK